MLPIAMRWLRRLAMLLGVLAVLGALGWRLLGRLTRIEPPPGALANGGVGTGRLEQQDGVWVLTLAGDPAGLGSHHAELVWSLMQRVDVDLQGQFRAHVHNALGRLLMPALARLRFRQLPASIALDRQRELAAEAAVYAPHDPVADVLPTYHRLLLYHALYDMALSFERSPLLGCSIFAVSGAAARPDGHLLVARNFDLEQDELDRDKVVIRVAERGRIPFAQVGWAGLTGVVTGLSARGIYAAVNGARAGEPRSQGVPLPFVLREVLGRAHSLEEAIAVAREQPVMVSHILFLGDGQTGRTAVIERSPSQFAVRRFPPGVSFVTNHFLSPELAGDPRNREVERSSTTLARYQRLAELAGARTAFGEPELVSLLRDRQGPGGARLAPGDRRAIDAGIATHSVIADATAGVLYVAQGPHTAGRYVPISVLDPDRRAPPE
jgi:hypothetical protein